VTSYLICVVDSLFLLASLGDEAGTQDVPLKAQPVVRAESKTAGRGSPIAL